MPSLMCHFETMTVARENDDKLHYMQSSRIALQLVSLFSFFFKIMYLQERHVMMSRKYVIILRTRASVQIISSRDA